MYATAIPVYTVAREQSYNVFFIIVIVVSSIYSRYIFVGVWVMSLYQ